MNCLPVFFIKVPPRCTQELTESLQDAAKQAAAEEAPSALYKQLHELGFLASDDISEEVPLTAGGQLAPSKSIIDSARPRSMIVEDFTLFPSLLVFVRQVLQYHIIAAACVLNDAHTRCLGM